MGKFTKSIPQRLKPALILRHLWHDSSRALTLMGAPTELFRSLSIHSPAGTPRNIFQNSTKPLSRTTWK